MIFKEAMQNQAGRDLQIPINISIIENQSNIIDVKLKG